MLPIISTVFAVGLLWSTVATAADPPQTDRYQLFLDLDAVVDDELPVRVVVPRLDADTVEYHLPRMVPGTYAVYDFGRFVSDFRAEDSLGQPLTVERLTDNRWRIANARALYQLSYRVEDSFDTERDNVIFEPAGTNIEAGRNFVINPFGFFGYVDGYQENDYELTVARPADFYGATALPRLPGEGPRDRFVADNYDALADAPIMYAELDTASFRLGGADVLVAVYSPNDVMSASFVLDNVREVLQAQRRYLGGTLPVDRYAFLIYLTTRPSLSGSMGALEHSYSSFYYLPEVNPQALAQTIRDVAAHEFFHIVTPLNLHSEEIGDFDYIEPRMSQHLWLYEGTTEYAAGHVQAVYDLIDLPTYLGMLTNKIRGSRQFNDTLPFTQMSRGALGPYAAQYGNVYAKGALIGLALDIHLRETSDGAYGLRDLIEDLTERYGPKRAFQDDSLFAEIGALTSPATRAFLERYVGGAEPLPLAETFRKVGVRYDDGSQSVLSVGGIKLGTNEATGRLTITDVTAASAFGRQLGYRVGDEFVSFDGQPVTPDSYDEVFERFRGERQAGDKITVVVARPRSDGTYRQKRLRARARPVRSRGTPRLTPDPAATEQQLALRAAWLQETEE